MADPAHLQPYKDDPSEDNFFKLLSRGSKLVIHPSLQVTAALEAEEPTKESSGPISSVIKVNKKITKSCLSTLGKTFVSRNTELAIADITKLAVRCLKDLPKKHIYYLPTGFLLLALFDKPQRPLPLNITDIPQNQIIDMFESMRWASAVYGWRYAALKALQNESGNTTYQDFLMSVYKQDSVNPKLICKYVGIAPEDLLIYQWDNLKGIFDPAHMVSVDHKNKLITITIRGTMSIKDSLTDIICQSRPFFTGYAHKGMAAAAESKYIILEDQLLKIQSKYKSYKIQIIGHSLGAGVASLLTVIFLENHPELNIHCFAYGCPAVMSEDLCEKYEHFINVYVVEDDVIPRLTYFGILSVAQKAIETRKETGLFFRKKKNAAELEKEFYNAISSGSNKMLKKTQSKKKSKHNLLNSFSGYHWLLSRSDQSLKSKKEHETKKNNDHRHHQLKTDLDFAKELKKKRNKEREEKKNIENNKEIDLEDQENEENEEKENEEKEENEEEKENKSFEDKNFKKHAKNAIAQHYSPKPKKTVKTDKGWTIHLYCPGKIFYLYRNTSIKGNMDIPIPSVSPASNNNNNNLSTSHDLSTDTFYYSDGTVKTSHKPSHQKKHRLSSTTAFLHKHKINESQKNNKKKIKIKNEVKWEMQNINRYSLTEIIVSNKMFMDHVPWIYEAAIRGVYKDYAGGANDPRVSSIVDWQSKSKHERKSMKKLNKSSSLPDVNPKSELKSVLEQEYGGDCHILDQQAFENSLRLWSKNEKK